MTTKLTKRQYTKMRSELEAKIIGIQSQTNDSEATRTSEEWDALYDAEYNLEQEIKDLDHKYQTRNWTTADWSSYDLVCRNID